MKKYLLTGLVILLPVALTVMIILFLFDLFTEPFVNLVGPLVNLLQQKAHIHLPQELTLLLSRILSLILLCAFILFLGFITQLFLVKTLIQWGNNILFRIPFIKTVYKVSRDIFAALLATDGKKVFKHPVMIPFPCKPNYCLGFESGELAQECKEKLKEAMVPVFIPTAPHPISGFFFFIPASDVHRVEMTNEEVVKFLVSCGMILPKADTQQEASHDLF
ncbi:MAG: DUF502 domain-containing protein [Verrucomicrobia bacterium]|nr:DUF502 domain-containing protein [Verrucomicrobiota bacterium]MBU6446678.1 DUF502 domain-containing protein [Verrucomicrobiota bacterium]MDE3046823.1 DUF502 domain-containing protein [Verrucomicrobiota bacterium]